MIIPLDKQQAEKIKEQHKKRVASILRTNGVSENEIDLVIEQINAYNKELGI